MKVERIVPRAIPPGKRKDFSEVLLGFTYSEALFESRRCLYCYDAPCIKGCPAGVNVPEFIARVRSENIVGAAKLIYAANPLGSICGRVCPTEALCEKACTSKLLNVPIAIGHLQRFVCDFALSKGKIIFSYPKPDKGPVAVVGGGPAGLSCAHFLRLQGYDVTLFEKEDALGGLLLHGIPRYRLPEQPAQEEIALMTSGLKRERGVFSREQAERILSEFQAVFLSPGTNIPVKLDIPGEEEEGVISANDLLREAASSKAPPPSFEGKEVAVIGGGASAMDAARTSLRLGAAKVFLLYRRSKEEMPAFPSEFEGALEEGVEFHWLVSPVEIRRTNGKLELKLERMRLGVPDESGRRSPVRTGRYFRMDFDLIIKAIAALPDREFLKIWPGLELDRNGYPISKDGQSTNPQIFLGGDILKAGTVVQAVADGKTAAGKIDNWLKQGGAR
jgi:glutamate synthase (NADPH/NADH) small chain